MSALPPSRPAARRWSFAAWFVLWAVLRWSLAELAHSDAAEAALVEDRALGDLVWAARLHPERMAFTALAIPWSLRVLARHLGPATEAHVELQSALRPLAGSLDSTEPR